MKALNRKHKLLTAGVLFVCLAIVCTVKLVSSAKEAAEYTKVISHTHLLRLDIERFVDDTGAFPDSLNELEEYWDRDVGFVKPPFGAEAYYVRPSESDPEDTVIYEADYRGKKVVILKNFTRVDER